MTTTLSPASDTDGTPQPDGGSDDSHHRNPTVRHLPFSGEQRLFILLGLAVVVVVFANHWAEFTPDTKPILYLNPIETLKESLSSWQPSPYQAGVANFNTGLAPVAAVIALIEATGLPPWATIRLWRAVLLLVGAWGAVRLYRHFDGSASTAMGRVATAVAFVANPFIIIGAGTTPLLLPYVLLPWLILCFAHAVAEPRRWRWPAAFAVVFFMMSGMQAGVVPLLLVLSAPIYVVYATFAQRVPLRDGLIALVKAALLALLASAYWIVPSALAASTGAAVVAESEDPRLVALTSSWAEGLRMLGLWPMYGRLGARLFLPKGLSYVVTPFVVLGSFTVPVAAAVGAWLSRNRGRAYAVLLLAVAMPVFVGLFPGSPSSPMGHLIGAVLAHVPGAIAFRTTVKMAPLIAMCWVLLIGMGAGALSRRAIDWHRPLPWVLGAVAVAGLLGGIYPALSNQLYNDGWSIPSYWRDAVPRRQPGRPRHPGDGDARLGLGELPLGAPQQ